MSKFVHIDMPVSHPGVDRLENTVAVLQSLSKRFDPSRAMATMLLAAIVSAILLAANALIKEVSDGHLLMAWIALWLVGFAALAMLSQPIRVFVRGFRVRYAIWSAKRLAAAQDAMMWEAALSDARVMSDLRAAMLRSAG